MPIYLARISSKLMESRVAGSELPRTTKRLPRQEQNRKSGFRPLRRAESKGATLVEAAIVLPVILLVVIGTMEIGLAFKDYLTVGALSREGARVAALAGRDADADCAVVRGIGAIATTGDLSRIASIQIYKAAEGTGNQGVTNVWTYTGGDPDSCELPIDPTDSWSHGAIAYTPGSRQTTVGSTPLDIIGVRITLDRSWVTGFPPFRGSFTIDESTITRLEPEAFE